MAKVTEARAASPSYVEYEIRDASPRQVVELRNQLIGCHWGYQQQMLEILEWVCGTDRQFDRARQRALDLINGQERAMKAILGRALAPKEGGDATTPR